MQRPDNVRLSSTEVEYVAATEFCKEIMFIIQVLEFMQVKINLPVIVQVDNVGAIYLENNDVSRRMKHIDVKYHIICEYVEEGMIKIIFVKSESNKADVFTNNTNDYTYN